MTVTAERPTLTSPRTLIAPELFNRLVGRIRIDHPEHAHQAEQIMTEALAFLGTCAVNPGASLGPSDLVDIGWHTFLMYTEDYARFCEDVAGRFIHHTPDDVEGTEGGAALAVTIAAIEAAGYPVNKNLWPKGAECTSKCNQCHAGCYDSPKKLG
ncbi:glycine-rich domain-containing protein [Streptosporangium sp. CA-135522]|uniref:glycine-rich domain-containing protein n=1 Tax=Streptosporangium sp. CA-135522 TaxID=3240072 RepID=UPI003D8FEC57